MKLNSNMLSLIQLYLAFFNKEILYLGMIYKAYTFGSLSLIIIRVYFCHPLHHSFPLCVSISSKEGGDRTMVAE
jgi:hypothetical protein